MALLRSSRTSDPAPIVRGTRVMLRAPVMADYPAWIELRALSRSHLTVWEPSWSRDELTQTAFRRRVRHYQRESREDLGYAYLVFAAPQPATASARGLENLDAGRLVGIKPSLRVSPTLVGGVTLTNVRRGVTQAATLGYWLGSPFVGRGLMHDALFALLPFAFDVLRLHRVEAAVMPSNAASLRVLARLGFTREGLARQYLKINGKWEDHLFFALLAEDVGRSEGGQL